VSNQQGKDIFDKAAAMARQVDILCCSMILTSDGRVFEALEGAFEDCRNRILRINPESTTIHLETVPTRIEKLVKRGWTNQIDVEKVVEEVKARRKKEEIEKIRKHAAAQRKIKKHGFVPSYSNKGKSYDTEFKSSYDVEWKSFKEKIESEPEVHAIIEEIVIGNNPDPIFKYKMTIPDRLLRSCPIRSLRILLNKLGETCNFQHKTARNVGGDMIIYATQLPDLFGLRPQLAKFFRDHAGPAKAKYGGTL
jgi:hypothetical protein